MKFPEGLPYETDFHREQLFLLIATLRPYLRARQVQAYVSGNTFIHYLPTKPPRVIGPDFYVVLDQTPEERPAYVAWEEGGKLPSVIVELTHESTEAYDRGDKYILYRDTFKTAEYFLYDPLQHRLEGFDWVEERYLPKSGDAQSGMLCNTLQLELRLDDRWLRWFERDGRKLPNDQELADFYYGSRPVHTSQDLP